MRGSDHFEDRVKGLMKNCDAYQIILIDLWQFVSEVLGKINFKSPPFF